MSRSRDTPPKVDAAREQRWWRPWARNLARWGRKLVLMGVIALTCFSAFKSFAGNGSAAWTPPQNSSVATGKNSVIQDSAFDPFAETEPGDADFNPACDMPLAANTPEPIAESWELPDCCACLPESTARQRAGRSSPFPSTPFPSTPFTVPRSALRSHLPAGGMANSPRFAPGHFSEFGPDGQPIDPEQEQIAESYYDPFGSQFTYGQAGVQPYRYGWYAKDEFVYVPKSEAIGIPGAMQILAWNSWLRYSARIAPWLLFNWSPEFNGVWWRQPAGSGLPSQGNELISDFNLSSMCAGAWNWQVGLTPQLNSDLRRSLDSNAFMIDARAVALYQLSSQWRFAAGAEYWDRVRNYVIPYGGVIWTPDDRWELRLLFPKTRISYYLGRFHAYDVWAFGSAEYQIQAYQIDTTDSNAKERGQWSNYQTLAGFNASRGKLSVYLQCGAILDRHASFNGPTPNFGLRDAFVLRTGLYY
jgi:hypothetical protein